MVNKWLATAESPSGRCKGRTSLPKSLTLAVLVELKSGAVGAQSVGSIADCCHSSGLRELFDGQSASDSMLRLVAGTVLLLLIGFTEALAVEEIKKDNVGPWEIEATFKDNKFDHCAISRKVDEVVASFLRTSDGLSLTLESPNWKLDRGKHYPVRMKAGAASWSTDVAAEANSVSVPISDKKIKEGLREASVFVVEGAGATIRIPLHQSRAALDRLDQCLTKNSRAVETNPFVAPTRQP
jgi:hypothetical protein